MVGARSEAALRAELEAFRGRSDASLLDAALLVAKCVTTIDEARVVAQLEGLAQAAMAAVPSAAPLELRVGALCDFLREGAGLVGSTERAFEKQDSLLPRVLEGGAGIPITLAVVYVEVARRLGFHAEGINFPGHFLVRLGDGAAQVHVDAFGGSIVTRTACEQLLARAVGPEAQLAEGHFDVAAPRAVLIRMLNNLKHQAIARAHYAEALEWSARILAAEPGLVFEHRDRAALHLQLEQVDLAIAELTELLAAVDEPALRARVEAEIARLAAGAGDSRTVH